MTDLVKVNETVNIKSGRKGLSIVPDSFAEVMQFSLAMKEAGTAIPKHLRGNSGACMAVAMQAFEWGMSPFAVANKSYSVNDRIAYEAQLIAAVVNTRSGMIGRLTYEFTGSGEELRCTVRGKFPSGVVTYTSPRFADITPKNSPLWKTDPEQQLGYYSARAWARRHVPEVILGVYDRDEIMDEQEQVQPPAPPTPPVELEVIDPPKPKATKKKEQVEEAVTETVDKKETPPTEEIDVAGIAQEVEEALGNCRSIEELQEVWDEFDLMAKYGSNEDAAHVFNSIFNRFKSAFESVDQNDKQAMFSND